MSRVFVGSEASSNIFAARFVSKNGVATGDVCVAYGNAVKPTFATVSVATGDEFTAKVVIPASEAGTLVAGGVRSKEESKTAVAGEVEVKQAGADVVKPTLEPLQVVDNAAAGAGAPEEDLAVLDMPLQERVDALAASMDELAAADEVPRPRLSGKKRKHEVRLLTCSVFFLSFLFLSSLRCLRLLPSSSLTHPCVCACLVHTQPVVASSLQVVLEQALQTQDDAQLEYCLAVTDPAVIHATVARLSTEKVLPFLSRYDSPSVPTCTFDWTALCLTFHMRSVLFCSVLFCSVLQRGATFRAPAGPFFGTGHVAAVCAGAAR